MLSRNRLLASIAFSSITLFAAACDEDDASPRTENDPLYVFTSLVFSPDADTGSTTYLVPTSAIVAQDDLTLTNAIERAGYAPSNAAGGFVFVGGDGPTLARLRVYDDGSFSENGAIGFNNYESGSLEDSAFISSTLAYQPYQVSSHVIWNPESMTIEGTIATPDEIPTTLETLPIRRGHSREVSGHYYYQPYYYANDAYQLYTETSKVLVVDTDTNSVVNVVDVPCPHLHITSQDAAGNVYFSNGQGSISAAVVNPAHPRNCFARIKAGETTLDTAFTTDFATLTGGREGSNVFVVGPNLAIFNVYHAERDTIPADPAAAYPFVDYSANYHLWTLDLTTMTASILATADYAGGQVVVTKIDGRNFLTVPAADYSSTGIFEISATASIEHLFDVQGWAFTLFRVR